MEKTTSYIPKLDAELARIATLKPRKVIYKDGYGTDFPGAATLLETATIPDVMIVGGGFSLPQVATAGAAAGLFMVVYEANEQKLGKGQVGLTNQDEYFTLGQHQQALIMPNFTPEQLEKMPLIKIISQLESVKDLVAKWKIAQQLIEDIGWKAAYERYGSFDKKSRISKREVISRNMEVIRTLEENGALKIIYESAGIDLISSRLDSNQAVFMVSGKAKTFIRSLQGCPGYVPELLKGDPATEKAFEIMKSLEERNEIAKVVVLGSGASRRVAVLEILNRMAPKLLNLQIITRLHKSDKTSESLRSAQRKVQLHLKTGYVEELQFYNGSRKIKSIKIHNAEKDEFEEISISLFIHSADEIFLTSQFLAYQTACEAITKSLEANPADNAFLRCCYIIPLFQDTSIGLRINTTFEFSLRDDEHLRVALIDLMKNRDPQMTPTILITGDNLMTKCVILLISELFTAEIGKSDIPPQQIKVIQLRTPHYAKEQPQHRDLDAMLKKMQVKTFHGHLEADGTRYEKETAKFHVRVRKSSDETEQFVNIDNVDAFFNAAGGTVITPLIEDMRICHSVRGL